MLPNLLSRKAHQNAHNNEQHKKNIEESKPEVIEPLITSNLTPNIHKDDDCDVLCLNLNESYFFSEW